MKTWILHPWPLNRYHTKAQQNLWIWDFWDPPMWVVDIMPNDTIYDPFWYFFVSVHISLLQTPYFLWLIPLVYILLMLQADRVGKMSIEILRERAWETHGYILLIQALLPKFAVYLLKKSQQYGYVMIKWCIVDSNYDDQCTNMCVYYWFDYVPNCLLSKLCEYSINIHNPYV